MLSKPFFDLPKYQLLKTLELSQLQRIDKKEQWAVKLFFEYFYGKPQQRVDVTTNDESINMPLINFVETEPEQ